MKKWQFYVDEAEVTVPGSTGIQEVDDKVDAAFKASSSPKTWRTYEVSANSEEEAINELENSGVLSSTDTMRKALLVSEPEG